MASRKEIAKMEERYPKYKQAIIRTIHKIRDEGYLNDHSDLSDEEIFDWWKSKKGFEEYYADKKLQYKLDL